MKPAHFLNRYTVSLVVILGVQALDTFALGSSESRAETSFLQRMPREINGWAQTHQAGLDADVQSALRPDDYLARHYTRKTDGKQAELVIVYFKSQQEGFGPHSPQVCLPAAGWIPVVKTNHDIRTGPDRKSRVNHFVIRKNGENGRHSAVLYWYQTSRRTTAGEVPARMWLALDTLAFKRSDISLVRLTVPMSTIEDTLAVHAATELSEAVHSELRRLWQ